MRKSRTIRRNEDPQQEEYLQKRIIRRAMHLLERNDRTEKNLRDKLNQSEYPEEMIECAMDYVKSYGYIDDARYARNYIRYRLETKSRQQIFQDLMQKGVNRELISEAWEEIAAEEQPDERKLIRTLVHKKCGEQKALSEKEYRRLQGYLARRGFSWAEVRSVLEEEEIHLEMHP